MTQPDVLVLGGGGVLGEAWMSALLAGLEGEGFDARGCRSYLGTSAGSIVAASLVAGRAPAEQLGRASEPAASSGPHRAPAQRLATVAELAGAAAAPLASLALSSTRAGGALARRAALGLVRPGRRTLDDLGRQVERWGARFDGRLRITALDLDSGRRVVFGAPGAPEVSVATAVRASCAIPGFFRPVEAGGRTYVDGGAWTPANMDAADARRGDRVVCLNPTGSFRPSLGRPAGALGPFSRGITGTEALALKSRGADVVTVNPDERVTAAMGGNLMDPRRRDAVIEAGIAQGIGLRRA